MSPSSTTEIVVYADADAVADALAERLLAELAQIQADRVPQLALTGGRIATKAYQRLAAEGMHSAVDWSRVDLWWGDERFVPADDDDRNDHATLALLTAALPLDEDRIHRMPASDAGLGLDAAAAAYAAELGNTAFDICLLGMGPDGHVASVFPGHPSAAATGRVIPVRDSPKPPPDRISLTLEVINASSQVWFVVSGADKADAAVKALLGAEGQPVPAAQVAGVERTLWLLDEASAGTLPRDLGQRR